MRSAVRSEGVRLCTALWPAPDAVAALRSELADQPGWPPEGWRATPSSHWHVTLCSHGEAEPGVLARRLEAATAGLPAPLLRLAGGVALPEVAAVRVEVAGGPSADALAALVRAAGADPADYQGQLTVARRSRRRDRPPARSPLGGHRGPWWRPAEVCLVRAELGAGSPRYEVLHRVPLLTRCAAAGK